MAQKDIQIYADILNESSRYEDECNSIAAEVKARQDLADAEEYDQLEDEIIDPKSVGFVDSDYIDRQDKSDCQTAGYDYGKVGNAHMVLKFTGDPEAFEKFIDVIEAYIAEKDIKGKLSYISNGDEGALEFTGDVACLKDIYAMFNGLDTAEELDVSDVVPFDQITSCDYMSDSIAGEDDVVCEQEDEFVQEDDTAADDTPSSIELEVLDTDAQGFRQAVKTSVLNVVTSIVKKTGAGEDGHSAIVKISGPLEKVKEAFALWFGVEDFESVPMDAIKEFDQLVVTDGDTLEEEEFRKRVVKDLDKFGIDSSTANLKAADDATGISVVEALKKKIESLERRLDGEPVFEAEDEIQQTLVDKTSDAKSSVEDDVTEVFDDEESKRYDDLDDGTVAGYKAQLKMLDDKLSDSATTPEQKKNIEVLKKYTQDLVDLMQKPLSKTGFAAPDFQVISHASNTYVDADGKTRQIRNDVMTPEQWQQYDQLRKIRALGKDLTPTQQEIWDKLIDQVKHATFSTNWTVYAPASTRYRRGSSVPAPRDDDDGLGPREYGAEGADDGEEGLNTGYATSDFEDVAYKNKDQQANVGDDDVYDGPIPTFNPDIDRDMATDRRSISNFKKKMTAAQKELLHDRALAVAKKNRGKPELWTMEDWASILYGLSPNERKELYHDLMDWTVATAGGNVSGEQGAIRKLFGRKRYSASFDGGSMMKGKEMTADQKKKANLAKAKESAEYRAFFDCITAVVEKFVEKFPTDRLLAAINVRLQKAYTLAYVTTPEEWEREAVEMIQDHTWQSNGFSKDWLKNIDPDGSPVTDGGKVKIDKETGLPQEPKMYVNFPSKFDTSKYLFGEMLPILIKHVVEDDAMLNYWKDLMGKYGIKSHTADDGKKTTTIPDELKTIMKQNKELQDRTQGGKKTRAKRK